MVLKLLVTLASFPVQSQNGRTVSDGNYRVLIEWSSCGFYIIFVIFFFL